MSQNINDNQQGIKQSWSLLSFVRTHGRMQVGEFTNKETGEIFKSCIFTDKEGERTFVSFSSKLGELTPQQIVEQKSDLQVAELNSGHFSLCKQGDNSWQDVDL